MTALDIAPGQIVERDLFVVGSDGRTDSRKSNKSASLNQEKHHAMAQERKDLSDPFASWIAITFDIPGALDRAALGSALLLFVQRHDVLRCRFQRLSGDLTCPVLGPDEIVLEPTEVGFFDTSDGVRSYVAECFIKNIDTLSWPLFVMGAVTRYGSSTVFLAFDHIVSDGLSMPNVVNDVATAYAAFADGREPVLPEAGSHVAFGDEQRHRCLSAGTGDERLAGWMAFTERNGGLFPRFPLELGVEQGRMYPPVNETDTLLDAAQTAALDTWCRDAGGKLFMGLLAAVAVSLRRAGGPDVYRR